MWVDLCGQSFADEQVRIESLRKGIVDYESLWRKTLASPAAERARSCLLESPSILRVSAPRASRVTGKPLDYYGCRSQPSVRCIALQADVIDADQFIKICTLWTTHKQSALGDLLIELGWITPIDKADVERLVERKLKRHGGDPRAGLAAVSDDVKRSLAALQDDDINRSLCDLPGPDASTTFIAVDDIPRGG